MINFSGISIESKEITDFLKEEMLLKEICQKIVYQKIIQRIAIERNITVVPDEIQSQADSIRFDKRLEKTTDTLVWLEEQMVTAEEWETGIKKHLLAQKLAEQLFDKEVESYFAQHRLDFDQFIFYQIIVPYQQLAQEIYYQIEEEEISFYEAAHLYDMDERRRYRCGYEGIIGRWSLPSHLAEAIGNANVKQVVGPIAATEKQEYHLLMIEEFIPAELTADRRESIINRFFKQLLEREFNYLIHNH
ncbi:MAG: peptidylprolyl isomerase [Cyanobacteria bacterium P01_G01_bin.19]